MSAQSTISERPRMLAYLRQSQSGGKAADDPSFQSFKQQRDKIAAYAALNELDIVGEVSERDVSGGKTWADRDLANVVESIRAGEADGVIAYDISRLGRNLVDFLGLVESVRAAKGSVVAINEKVDTTRDDPMGTFFLHLTAAMAEMERGRMRERFAVGVRNAADRGVYPARPPFGYRPSVLGHRPDGKPIHGPLEVHPVEGPVVSEVFRMRAAGAGLAECCRYVRAHVPGIKCGNSHMAGIFASEAYLGHIRIGKDIFEEGTHPALVDRATWEAAHRRKGASPIRTGTIAGKGILVGLVTCSGCGHRMTVSASGKADNRKANYTCGLGRIGGCPAPATAQIHLVDSLVLPELDARAAMGGIDQEAMLVELHDAMAAQAAARAELDSFMAAGLVSVMGAEAYAKAFAQRQTALDETNVAYSKALEAQEALAQVKDEMSERREVARQLLESVTIGRATRTNLQNGWCPVEERVELVWRAA